MEKNNKKSIVWVTAGYMLQVDLPILSYLNERYKIKWIVYAAEDSDKGHTAKAYAAKHGIDVEFYVTHTHHYLPFVYIEYSKQMKRIAKLDYDLYYFDMVAFPFMIFAIKKHIPSHKVIMAMHHGKIHNGMRLKYLYKHYLEYLCKQNFRFQYYSETQAQYFTGKSSSRYIIPLALNDFGKSTTLPPNDYVQFLSFGHIIETKNIGLLIKAACLVKERCTKPFMVKIAGHCRTWDSAYQPLIKYPEIFDLRIESVPDADIPDLFCGSHYLVLPYKSVTQSGPLRIAYGYNLPVITSDLEGFKESVEVNVTGLMFKTEDVESLANLMQQVIENHPATYKDLKSKELEYVNCNLRVDAVVDKYAKMFDHILKGNENKG